MRRGSVPHLSVRNPEASGVMRQEEQDLCLCDAGSEIMSCRGGSHAHKKRHAEHDRKVKSKGVVKQAKVVFESNEGSKVDEASGGGRSRGYGFIEYYTQTGAVGAARRREMMDDFPTWLEEIKSGLDDLAKNPAIDWLGRKPLDEVLDLIGAADVLIFPSQCYETFGRTAVESKTTVGCSSRRKKSGLLRWASRWSFPVVIDVASIST